MSHSCQSLMHWPKLEYKIYPRESQKSRNPENRATASQVLSEDSTNLVHTTLQCGDSGCGELGWPSWTWTHQNPRSSPVKIHHTPSPRLRPQMFGLWWVYRTLTGEGAGECAVCPLTPGLTLHRASSLAKFY